MAWTGLCDGGGNEAPGGDEDEVCSNASDSISFSSTTDPKQPRTLKPKEGAAAENKDIKKKV